MVRDFIVIAVAGADRNNRLPKVEVMCEGLRNVLKKGRAQEEESTLWTFGRVKRNAHAWSMAPIDHPGHGFMAAVMLEYRTMAPGKAISSPCPVSTKT